jgi:hypothetical protein
MDFLKSRLEAEGIPAVLTDQETIVMHWMLANALGGIKLLVLEDRVRDAHEIMKAAQEEREAREMSEREDGKCPACGSADVGEKAPRWMIWLLICIVLLTLGLGLIPVIVYWYRIKVPAKVMICSHCRHTWIPEKEGDAPPAPQSPPGSEHA